MKIGLIAIAGVKMQTRKFIELGVTLPQFMNRGRVVESGVPTDILDHPKQDYTRELMAAIPTVDERWSELAAIDVQYRTQASRNPGATST